nr:O-antigen ligase family protein [uncultured Bacteroides sp.]
MYTFIHNKSKLIKPKILLYVVLLIGIALFYKTTLQKGYYFGAFIACLPFLAIGIFLLLKRPLWSFIFLFITNYFIMGITRYIHFQGGILMDIIILFCFGSILIKATYDNLEWKRMLNPLTLTTFLWVLFCILELLNPKAVPIDDWTSQVRGLAIYPLAIVVLISILLCKYKHLKLILFLWSIFTIIGAFKGYWQKNHGFDSAELYWLYVGGGAKTHFIHSGIRFFSFFTDAGNYGSSMGFSMVVFSIAAIFIKNKWIKIYFSIVALAGGYGMIISGTRGALAAPFAGYILFVALSKNFKMAITGLSVLFFTFLFLNYTTIGNSNKLISRMRTAFDQNDASLNVRLENQKKLREYMADVPFGTSIGFYGKSVNSAHPYYGISKIPSDSWYVRVWIQTGIVGLTLHIFLLSIVILIGGYIILFKIKNEELRGLLIAMLAGTFGILASSYGNELLGQFPNCFLFYTCQALVFMGKYYDKELEEHEQPT